MGCITEVISRLALLYVWIWTPLVNRAFGSNFIVPLLGIIFLPCTTLAYVLVNTPGVGVTGWGWLWVVLGLVLDLGAHSHSTYKNRRRIPRYKTAGDS
ncbi:MAG TPA: hypothetical protein VH540_27350 [Ktedonobacterales bacterium]